MAPNVLLVIIKVPYLIFKGAFSFLVTQGALFFTLTGKYDFRFSRMLSFNFRFVLVFVKSQIIIK
jgi:hypothetical protein